MKTAFPFPFDSAESLLNRVTNASIDETPCARNVAHATPATPMSSAVTDTTSSTILPSDEKIRKYSGVFESPRAVKIPVHML